MKTSEAYEMVMETLATRATMIENAVDNRTANEIINMTYGKRFDRLNEMQIKARKKAEKLWDEYIGLEERRRKHLR